MNARRSFWIIKAHQSPAFSIIFNIFPRYAIVDAGRQGVTGLMALFVQNLY